MGTGIGGVILLEFTTDRGVEKFAKDSVSGFLDNYNLLPKGDGARYERYAIKEDVLFPNYADFIKEFYTLVYDKFEGIRAPSDEIPDEEYTEKALSCKTMEEFEQTFSHSNRNGSVPLIDTISCLGSQRNLSFLFYMGSYKAYNERITFHNIYLPTIPSTSATS